MNLRLKSAKIRYRNLEFEIDKIEYEIKNDESLKMKFLGQRTSNEDTRGY